MFLARVLSSKLPKHMNSETKSEQAEPSWFVVLRGQIESLRFGTVQVVVHESRVVQIEKTEKVRFVKSGGNLSTNTAESVHRAPSNRE